MSLNNLHSFLASGLRFGRGLAVIGQARQSPPRPEKLIELYGFEGCPVCRKVREVISELDLAYIERTCPKGDTTKRAFVAEHGKSQFPFLLDPNTGTELYESEDIITYLVDTYGGGRSALGKAASPLNTLSSAMTTVLRPAGSRVRSGLESREQPEQLLELWSFEISPFCRKVREVLTELNLDFVVHNVAKKSARRKEMIALAGRVQVPYLVDPNRGEALFESDEIIAYLEEHYGV